MPDFNAFPDPVAALAIEYVREHIGPDSTPESIAKDYSDAYSRIKKCLEKNNLNGWFGSKSL